MNETPKTPTPELKLPPFWELLIPFVAASHYLIREKTEPKVGNGLLGTLMGISEVAYFTLSFEVGKELDSWPAGAGTYVLGRFGFAAIAGLRKD